MLVEAFLPRRNRYVAQVVADAWSAWPPPSPPSWRSRPAVTAGTKAHIAAMGAVAVDGPALFLQGTDPAGRVFVGIFTFAERRLPTRTPHGNRVDSFTAQAARGPGQRQPRRPRSRPGFTTTEVFPLTLFAVGGMLSSPRPTTC